MSNILSRANEIVNLRSEEKEREYGNFEDSMVNAAKMLSIMTGTCVDAHFMYLAMICLKLSREAFKHKEDNLLDACAYIGAMNDFLEKNKKI